MKSNPLLKQTLGTVLLTLLFTLLCFLGCGAAEDDNSQPSIETITDQTLNVGDETTVKVTITDADVDDTHTISTFTDDTTIATVSVRDATLTITGMKAGPATVTVSATDNSGQDNAAAIPVTFEVTVNSQSPTETFEVGIGLNQPPSSFIDKGDCTVGMTLKPGEGCSYDSNDPFAEIIFSVLQDGTVCREQVPLFRGQLEIPGEHRPRNLKFCVEWDIEEDDFFETSFSASKNPDGSWTIEDVP
jgi:hypothetical protein